MAIDLTDPALEAPAPTATPSADSAATAGPVPGLALLLQRAATAAPDQRPAAVAAARHLLAQRLQSLDAGAPPVLGDAANERRQIQALLALLSALLVTPAAVAPNSLSPESGVAAASPSGVAAASPSGVAAASPSGGATLDPPAPVIGTLGQVQGTLNLALSWTVGDPPVGVPRSGFTAALFEGATPGATALQSQELGADARTAVFPNLVIGHTYCAVVTAHYTSTLVIVTTKVDKASAPSPAVKIVDPHAADPIARVAPVAQRLTGTSPEAQRAAAEALGLAGRWRSNRLLTQAVEQVERANGLEALITQLQSLELTKLAGAETILQPVLQNTLGQVAQLTGTILDTSVPGLDDALHQLTDKASQFAIVAWLIEWLANTDVLDFWKDLFWSIIGDIAAFDGDLSRCRGTIRASLARADLVLGVQAKLEELRTKLLDDEQVLAGQVRHTLLDAITMVTGGLSTALSALDVDVLHDAQGNVVALPGAFAKAISTLTDAVNAELATIRDTLLKELDKLTHLDTSLFEDVVIVFFVLPILSSLVIAVAGGPFVAAALAFIVLVVAEELIHLIIGWLIGPITDQLNDLKAHLDQLEGQVEGIVGDFGKKIEGELTKTAGTVEGMLGLVAEGLRGLKDLLPRVYLDESANLLGRARDALITRATSFGHAAEVALGQECAAVFDILDLDYATNQGRLPAVQQLPGGQSPGRLAGERLVVDISRLVESQLRQDTGREMLITQRLSVFSLLQAAQPLNALSGSSPTDALKRLLLGQDLILDLSEEALLDGAHPGAHRALIERVRLTGVVSGIVSPAAVLPVQVTHLGASRTRVKRSATGTLGPEAERLSRLLSLGNVTAAYKAAVTLGKGLAEGPADVLTADERARYWPAVLNWAVRFQARNAAGALGAAVGDLDAILAGIAGFMERAGFPVTDGLIQAVPGSPFPTNVDGSLLWNDASNQAGQYEPVNLLRVSLVGLPPSIPAQSLPTPRPRYGLVSAAVPGDSDIATWATALSRDLQIALSGGKWGEAHLEEDPNPDLRALGFAVLVRDRKPETLSLALAPSLTPQLPASGAVGTVTSLLTAGGAGLPSEAEAYRPLETRGLGGQLLIRLPGANGTGLTALTDQVGSTTARLTDLILEMDLRVCHDDGLAAALRASSARRGSLDSLVKTLTGRTGAFLDTVGVASRAEGRRFALKYSLRSHRDVVLSAWKEIGSAVAGSGIPVDPSSLPFLGPNDPLDLLGSTNPFELSFAAVEDPLALAHRLTVTPAMLGLATADLADTAGVLTGLGFVAVPLKDIDPTKVGQAVTASGPAKASLPPQVPLTGLNVFEFPPDKHVALSSLFASTAPLLSFALDPLIQAKQLHDLLLTVIVTVPATHIRPGQQTVS